MNRLFRTTVVETSGVRTISGGGTNASNAGQALANLGGVSLTGNQTISGIKTFASRPTVNGTGVLLSGEVAAQLPNTIVYTTGDQTISGIKTFSSRPQVSTTGVILSNTIHHIITLTQAEYDAIGSPVSTTLYIITDP
jgi:hypothetical protein